jgi:hypothetical protein
VGAQINPLGLRRAWQVFQCILFCQEGAPVIRNPEIEAEYHDVPFNMWATMNASNKDSVIARMHEETQEACRTGHPNHPFGDAVGWQTMIGPISEESWKRGLVYQLTVPLALEMSPYDMTRGKNKTVIGFDNLFCKRALLRPEFRPPADVTWLNKMAISARGATEEQDRRPTHVQAPQYHIAFYHGDLQPGGDDRLGRDFPILNHPSTEVEQNQFPEDMFKVPSPP